MASRLLPVRGVAYSFTTALTLQSDTKLFKANPTLASGDVLVSKDHGATANITTLPDAEPDATKFIRVLLSATEMDADQIVVLFSDAAGAEWADQMITIHTAAVGADDLARTGADADTLETLSDQMDIIGGQTDDIGVAGAGLTAIPTIAAVTTVASTTTIGATGLAAIAAAVWNALTSGLTTVGSIGALVVAKLNLITSSTAVTISSPVAANGNVTTYAGDDYDTADGRAITFPVSSTAVLAGGTIAVVLHGVGSYVGAIASETSVTLDLTKTQTAAIPTGRNVPYSIVLTQSVALGADVITLRTGYWMNKAAHSAT